MLMNIVLVIDYRLDNDNDTFLFLMTCKPVFDLQASRYSLPNVRKFHHLHLQLCKSALIGHSDPENQFQEADSNNFQDWL